MDDDHVAFLERHRIRCGEVEELVDSFIDGEMTATLRGRFEAHLDQCESCRRLVDDSLRLAALAQSLRERPIPQQVRARLRERLRSEVGYESPAQRLRPQLRLVKSE